MTTYTYVPKDNIQIPKDWTCEQAKFVWEFLGEILTTIWEVHENRILEATEREDFLLERAARGDDYKFTDEDYPF